MRAQGGDFFAYFRPMLVVLSALIENRETGPSALGGLVQFLFILSWRKEFHGFGPAFLPILALELEEDAARVVVELQVEADTPNVFSDPRLVT